MGGAERGSEDFEDSRERLSVRLSGIQEVDEDVPDLSEEADLLSSGVLGLQKAHRCFACHSASLRLRESSGTQTADTRQKPGSGREKFRMAHSAWSAPGFSSTRR